MPGNSSYSTSIACNAASAVRLVPGGNRGNRVTLEAHFIDNQKRLIRFRIQVTVFAGNVSMCNHGVYTPSIFLALLTSSFVMRARA